MRNDIKPDGNRAGQVDISCYLQQMICVLVGEGLSISLPSVRPSVGTGTYLPLCLFAARKPHGMTASVAHAAQIIKGK